MKTKQIVSFGFGNHDIVVAQATSEKDNQAIAIHLLNPTNAEIDAALERAALNNFELIVCHTDETWPNKPRGAK